jgi:hypothetical protein
MSTLKTKVNPKKRKMPVLAARNEYANKAETQWTHAMKTRDIGTHQRKTSPRYNSNMDLGPEFVIEP